MGEEGGKSSVEKTECKSLIRIEKEKKMSPISSESIFHFTKYKNNLIGILQNEFYPGLCFERYELKDRVVEGYFPMVSFCDIPLSQIRDHIKTYGSYGIGMSKKWAEKMGLNPVLYIKKNSQLSCHIDTQIQTLISMVKKKYMPKEGLSDVDSIRKALLSILTYVKPFEGTFLKGKKKKTPIKFYNEREVRYVPPAEKINDTFILTKKQYSDVSIMGEFISNLRKVRLSFGPDDIKYIIIKNENEIPWMAEKLRDIKEKYKNETVQKLLTRIITSRQIKEDF